MKFPLNNSVKRCFQQIYKKAEKEGQVTLTKSELQKLIYQVNEQVNFVKNESFLKGIRS
jgi:hypothetical protein